MNRNSPSRDQRWGKARETREAKLVVSAELERERISESFILLLIILLLGSEAEDDQNATTNLTAWQGIEQNF